MENISASEFLERLKQDSIKISEEIMRLSGLSDVQLNRKPDEKSWSVGQCIDHINNTDRPYFDGIKAAFGKADKSTGSYSYQPAFPGTLLIKAMSPQSKMKIKAQKVFRPAMSNVGKQVFDTYNKQHQELLSLLENSKNYNLNKIKVASPALKLMRMRIGDALRVLVMHRQRHLEQANRVMQNPGFPKE